MKKNFLMPAERAGHYESPAVTMVEIAVESGFALSNVIEDGDYVDNGEWL